MGGTCGWIRRLNTHYLKRGERVRKLSALVGKRLLISRHYSYGDDVSEVTLLEISPSGKRLKFEWESGSSSWESKDEYDIAEVLETRPPKEVIGR